MQETKHLEKPLFKQQFAVCSEKQDGYGWSMAIIERFDTYEEAKNYIYTSKDLHADFYYIQRLFVRRD